MLFCTNYVLLAQLRSAPASCPYTEKLRLHRRQQPSDGRTLTPAAANQFGWQVQWSAVTGRYDLVTQSYSFNGQRIAQRKDGVLTYLHADQVGSTLLATDVSGAVVGNNQPRYFAYGREPTPSLAALPTDYTYTGQKQDGSGLVYMNARYYDPVIGQFISADTEVPDPTNLFSYNRFMYVNGNPLRYNDPSGHGSPTAGALPQPDTWQAALDAIKLAANNGAAIVGPVLAAAPMGTVAAVVLGGGAYGLAHTTDALPSVPALYPNLGVGNGNISITIPVPGSTTMTSGVPLTPGAQTQSTGATAVNQPAQNIIEPLPAQQKGSNIVTADFSSRAYTTKEIVGKKGTYTLSFDSDGNPIFDPYAIAQVKIDMKGNYTSDFTEANRAAGYKTTPSGYTWHHHQDGATMQLVPTDLHKRVFHYGGVNKVTNR